MGATRSDDVQLWQGYMLGKQLRATIAHSFREGFRHALSLVDRLIRDDPSLWAKAREHAAIYIDQWAAEMGDVTAQEDAPHRADPSVVKAWREKMGGGGLVSREDLRELLALLVD
jgi:hypothetical protein